MSLQYKDIQSKKSDLSGQKFLTSNEKFMNHL